MLTHLLACLGYVCFFEPVGQRVYGWKSLTLTDLLIMHLSQQREQRKCHYPSQAMERLFFHNACYKSFPPTRRYVALMQAPTLARLTQPLDDHL